MVTITGQLHSSHNGLLDKRGVESEVRFDGVVWQGEPGFQRNSEKDAVLRENLVLAVVEVTELKEKASSNFAVEGRSRIPMDAVVMVFPEKDHLGE